MRDPFEFNTYYNCIELVGTSLTDNVSWSDLIENHEPKHLSITSKSINDSWCLLLPALFICYLCFGCVCSAVSIDSLMHGWNVFRLWNCLICLLFHLLVYSHNLESDSFRLIRYFVVSIFHAKWKNGFESRRLTGGQWKLKNSRR